MKGQNVCVRICSTLGYLKVKIACASVGPGLESDSLVGVDLANMGAKSTTDVVARARVPSSLKDLVNKYCVATCEIPVERIVPGNNPRLMRFSGVKVIQDAIQNSGWDESSTFIVQL